MACGKVTLLTIFVVSYVFANVGAQKTVLDLTEDNWSDMLKNEWMVEFYAPWCPACKGLETTWRQFAEQSPGLGIKVGKVDVTTSPGLSGRFMVTALPTIFHVLNGEFRQYKGSRDKDSFITFVEEKKWQQVDPVSSWKSPNSFQMSVVSWFFKLSQSLRQLHNKLMEDFGLPQWGSYLIFAIATIFTGALLGLILVCVLDLIYPPKHSVIIKSSKMDKEKDKESGDELDDEDIRDDLLDDRSQSEGTQSEGDLDAESDPTGPESSSPKVKKRKPRRD